MLRTIAIIVEAKVDPDNQTMCGWATIIRCGAKHREMSGYRKGTRLSSLLHGILEGVCYVPDALLCVLAVDHISVQAAIQARKIFRWWADGWLTADGQPITEGRWEELHEQMHLQRLMYVGAPHDLDDQLPTQLEALITDSIKFRHKQRSKGSID